MFSWPFESASTLLVQGWGFWLTAIGLLVSFIGFFFTIQQLVRTRAATTAVSEELKKVQFAVAKYDATMETSRAETSLKAARNYLRSSEWAKTTDELETFRRALHILRQLDVPEISPHADALDEAMAHAGRLCERLDRLGAEGLSVNEMVKTQSTMREHDLLMDSLRVALDRSNFGE